MEEETDNLIGYLWIQMLSFLLIVSGLYKLSAATFLGKTSLPSHWIFFKSFLALVGTIGLAGSQYIWNHS